MQRTQTSKGRGILKSHECLNSTCEINENLSWEIANTQTAIEIFEFMARQIIDNRS